MLRTRGMRKAFTAVAIAAVAGLALPAQAMADPAAPPAPESVPIEFLASFAPAIIGAAAGPADVAGGPQQALLDQARAILNSPGIPPEIKATLEKVITFLDGSGGGGPAIPDENAPVIAQFLYPTLGKGCISPPPIRSELHLPFPARPTCLLPVPLPVRPDSSSPLSVRSRRRRPAGADDRHLGQHRQPAQRHPELDQRRTHQRTAQPLCRYRRYRPRTRSLGDQRFADHPAGRRRSHHLQLPSDRGHVRGSLIEVL